MARFLFEAYPRGADANNDPASGAKLYVYEAGTTTPVTVYSDKAMTVAHAIPVVADASGAWPEIYAPDGRYKVVITNAYDVTLQTVDNVLQFAYVEGSERTVDSVADMVADADVSVGGYIRTLGYFAPGDGGGNLYQIVAAGTGTADGGSYIDLTGISGQAKGLFDGYRVYARQFGVPTSGDASAQITAMNDYVLAARAVSSSTAFEMVFEGLIELAEPVTLGGLPHIKINAINAKFSAIPGGDLEANGNQAMITAISSNSEFRWGELTMNSRMCGGIRITNSTNTRNFGPRLDKFGWRGITVDIDEGSCAGTIIYGVTGREWGNLEDGFNDSASFVATGIHINANDVRVVHCHIGYCGLPIHNDVLGNGVTYLECHPFNGNPNEGYSRQHSMAFQNDCPNRVFAYDCYWDNGYIVDNTATLHMSNCWGIQTNSTLTDPVFRIKAPANPDDIRGAALNCAMTTGFFTGAHDGPSPTLVPSYNYTVSESANSRSQRVGYSGKVTHLFPNFTDDVARHDVVQGGTTGAFIHQVSPGTGVRVRLKYVDGTLRVLSGTGSDGELHLTNLGDGGGIGTNGADGLALLADGTTKAVLQANGTLRPTNDGSQDLGQFNQRWAKIFATQMRLTSLPTSATGLTAGDLWRDGEVVKVKL